MKNALEIDSKHFRILFNMGVFNKKLGNLDLAEEYYKKSIEENPYYPYSYLNYAVMYRAKEDYKRAIEIINKGIEENEDEGFLYYNRACFYVAINELDLALEDVLKSIELNDFFEDYMKKDEELDGIRNLEKYKKMF
ncbi:tetratricopeptide repeat protein [Clostridium celatum DSM 1785]|uniref:Tetratricopeptide repeat protein n=1 Tax=Clostridium celatum DSM 1785 TaxID=545697 RepID=L1QPP0_9CLOT|nr:tetratricopeptide repeat protein [Clostridium celatum DSM 1785]